MHKKYIYAWKCGLNCIFTDFSCGAHFFVLGAPAPLYPEVLFERMAQVVAVEVRIDFGGEDAFVSEASPVPAGDWRPLRACAWRTSAGT